MRSVTTAILTSLLTLGACKDATPSPSGAAVVVPTATGSAAAPATDAVTPAMLDALRAGRVFTTVAIYYLPTATVPAKAAFDELVRAEPGLNVVDEPSATTPLPSVTLEEPAIANYAPPDAESLQYFARGLSPQQTAALPTSRGVAVLTFCAAGADAVAQLRRAQRLATALAAKTGGIVWSDDQRLAFGADAWRERGAKLAADPVDAVAATNLHIYAAGDDGSSRAVTLGLGQLALPDLVIENAPVRAGVSLQPIIALVAQTLLEGTRPTADGTLALDVATIGNPAARAALQNDVLASGTGKGTVRLRLATPDEGDAPGLLWRIDFPGAGTYLERMVAASAGLFGRVDQIKTITADDDEMLAASARAKLALAKLEAGFGKGVAKTDHLIVKAPFTTSNGGQEYMWIEVRAWKAGVLRGVLTDEPFQVPDLHAGATVEVKQADVYDYLLQHVDGREEGGETSAILLRRAAPTP